MSDSISINQRNGSSPIVRQLIELADVSVDSGALSPLVKRLLASAEEENRRVAELCDAVLRRDWDTATTAAKILSRKLETSPKPALPSTPAQSSASTENCA